MDVLQGRKGAVSPVSGVLSSQSRVLLACFLGFFPQTRDLGSLGTEGHPRGSRGGAGADLAGSPVPGGGTWVPGSGLGLASGVCRVVWGPSPPAPGSALPATPQPAPAGWPTPDPATRSNSDPPPGHPALPCPVPTSGLATGPSSPPALASAHPQPRCGMQCWSAPVSSSRRGLWTLLPGQHLASRGLGSEQAALGRAVTADPLLGGSGNSGAGPAACLPRIVHLAAASSLGTPWGPAGQGLQKTLDGVPVLQAVSLCL